jgi:hypothetical protein
MTATATPKAIETAVLSSSMNNSTDTEVMLEEESTTAAAGVILLIDAEYMTITDAAEANALQVTRGTAGVVTSHASGSQVSIGETIPAPIDTENENQVLLVQLAATMFANPTMHSLNDAYQQAKNLIAIMLADPEANPPTTT